MNARASGICIAALLIAAHLTPAGVLPIYIEDNHAGTFYWLAQNIDLDSSCTLVLFDAHSDASGIFDSDKIRYALRDVVSSEARQKLLDEWRSKGTIQCFNWIEPLMPAPIAKVVWVPGEKLSPDELRQRAQQATELLDGHLEAAPRKSGSLRKAYAVSDFENLNKHLAPGEPLIVTVDLDYFAGLSSADQQSAFTRIWDFIIERPNLRAITFAISRPYLSDEHEANRLLKLALTSALSLPTARIQFEPFRTVANDHSQLAKTLIAQGKTLPQFELTCIPDEIRCRILSERQHIVVAYDHVHWEQLLRAWEGEAPRLHLEVKQHHASTDNIWRIPADEPADIELVVEPWMAKPKNIQWFVLEPKYWRCNVTDLSADQVGFIANAAPRPAWKEIPIDYHDSVLPITKIENFFDRHLHCGSLRLRARAVVDGQLRETSVMELRRFIGSGFRAAVTEQFGLPYLFGSGELAESSSTGPETNLGADCANFVAYALRRQGQRVRWSDPRQLRDYLDPVAKSAAPGAIKITDAGLQQGTIVHLGTHVAVVMEDRDPVGILDGNDLVAHQLAGRPEMMTLRELLNERKKDHFDVLSVRAVETATTVVFGGDVMLGRSCAGKIENGADPFEGISSVLGRASFAAANLECTISNLGESAQRYSFRAPARSAELVRRAGFHAVGLANNHALDFGFAALADCAVRLDRENVVPVGVQTSRAGPYSPRFFPMPGGKKVGVLAISDVQPATNNQIATASDRARLRAAIADARLHADLVVCMVHWGIENSEKITDQQRELARWLIERGVDLVVGSHPHCVQPLDFYHGCPVAYSLGNLVFDGAPGVQSWNRGALLEIGLNDLGKTSSVSLIPVVLEDGSPSIGAAGKQRLVETSAR
jgi:poly-gamma-glutamate capsule biosynthesis protein CapA/YwtB (metallophosphatase superfamily)